MRSYRDTWRLFLRFAAARHQRAVVGLTLADLTAREVLAFLQHSELSARSRLARAQLSARGTSAAYGFVAEREPAAVAQCAEVRHIPTKKAVTHAPQYLGLARDRGHPRAAKSHDRGGAAGPRAALLPHYIHGRASVEALDVCPAAIRLRGAGCVRLGRQGSQGNAFACCSRRPSRCPRARPRHRAWMTRPCLSTSWSTVGASGVRFKLAQWVHAAARAVPSLASKKVTPHAFGLRGGGASGRRRDRCDGDSQLARACAPDTTNHYAQANLETKREARSHASPRPPRSASHRVGDGCECARLPRCALRGPLTQCEGNASPDRALRGRRASSFTLSGPADNRPYHQLRINWCTHQTSETPFVELGPDRLVGLPHHFPKTLRGVRLSVITKSAGRLPCRTSSVSARPGRNRPGFPQ